MLNDTDLSVSLNFGFVTLNLPLKLSALNEPLASTDIPLPR